MSGGGRVLCVTSNFPRWEGDSTTPFVLHLCQDLKELGWDVDVLAPHAPDAAREEELGGVRVERFRYFLPEAAQTVCYQGGALINLRRRPVEKLKLPLLVLSEWAAVARRLARGEYQLLHSHWVLPQGFVGMLAARATGVPHVVTVHGGDLFALRRFDRLKRWALESADAVTVNSSFTERWTRALAPGLDRVERIPMGVNDAPLSQEERAAAARLRAAHRLGAGPILVFVGRLVEEKGAQDAIEAVALLRQDFPEVRLLVVGRGQDEESLERRVRELGIEEHVKFMGWLAPQEVRAVLHAADVFIGPSRRAANGWVEAQGLTFLEAMASEVPVVATRSGGIVDAVRHEETGLLVEERSPRQIASAVARLLLDAPLRERLTRRGRELLVEGFSRAESARRMARVYERLVK